MEKTKDIFLNIAVNPQMTLEDLVSVGLTSENTVLLDRASYASNEKVQDLFKDSNGNFDEKTFNAYYDIAEKSYNVLNSDEVNLNLLNVTAYDSDNIFVDPSKRRQVNAPVIMKLPNPDRLNTGVTRIGKTSDRTLSRDEIAQTQEVLLNPVEVAKGAKPIYGDSPNDSWFKDFWDTRVMASWDEDGVHIDPVTGKEVKHLKGDLKLNENGTYYYESLDGRSVYGKQILNKFNTLTTDGSSWNKYDFFDSDSIEQKSVLGSVAKNLALVGSMFIPYVGWGVAAASVAHQSMGLFATLGKMLAGSDSPSLNAIEGWVKSTDRRNLKTEYAQQNMWCWENFIDLIGDTTAQLREQRAIFKFVPGILKGGDFRALDDKAMEAYTQKLAKEGLENATKTNFKDLVALAHKQNPANAHNQLKNLIAGAKDIYTVKAQKATRKFVEDYYKLGEPIARAYMTAITVQDTFGEAIQAGASDNEATLLTLGYAAAEAALLSTDLGKWIMPELRAEKQRYKMIAKKLMELPPETREMSKQVARLGNETKKDWAKRLFNMGKDILHAEYSTATKTLGTVLAQGLGEGIEEVSEEALADFSKTCFNLAQQLRGDDTRMNAWNHNWSWSEAANRYGMSFVGGIMGGGINAAASDYKANRELVNMNSQQALQQLIYMTRNDELPDFWKTVNKMELAPKNLSTQLNDSGTGYKPGTKTDNQDLEAKKALKKQIDLISSIIDAENAKLNDGGLLSALIKADPSLQDLEPVKEYRMRALSNSVTAGRFLNEFNTVLSDIAKVQIEQYNITSKYGDVSSEKYADADKQRLKDLGKTLKELQARKEGMLNGERTREYVRDAMFEMTHAVNEVWDILGNEVRYAEAITGKKYVDIAEDKKKELKEQYEQIKNSNQKAEQIHALADIYEALAIAASDGIQQSADYLAEVQKGQYENINRLDQWASARLSGILGLLSDQDQGVSKLQDYLQNGRTEDILTFVDSPSLQAEIAAYERTQDYDKIAQVMIEDTFNQMSATCDEILKAGFVHPETKQLLKRSINRLGGYLDDLRMAYDDAPQHIEDKVDSLYSKLDEIDKLSNTPILENLKRFQASTNTDKSVLDLINYLIEKEHKESKDISTFQLDQATLDTFKEARQLLEMYRSAIVGARYDNVDIDSIVGFNTTLNEISGPKDTIKLAEIDAVTADLILEDINTLLKRLDYAEELHSLNSGNKYNVQNKTALNKQYILHNRIKQFISTVQDDDEWKDKNDEKELADLITAVNNASILNANSGFGSNYEARNFALSPNQKAQLEKESIDIQTALHKFLSKHVDGSDASVDKLAKLLTYDNFKGLIRENNDYLNASSLDIDDSAFIWWLCATAALNPDQFFNNYRSIIGEEKNGEKPIAPIPTQELGIFALTAAVVNGDMFSTFGKALRKSLLNTWESNPETRKRIQEESGMSFFSEDQKEYFKNADFLPNFDNILFVEGIAGSGKSTGVLRSWSKLMAKANPDFIKNKIIFAHTDKKKAEALAKSTAFTNVDLHDHDSLLSYMSPDYVHQDSSDYVLGKDVLLVDGILRSPWKISIRDAKDVPKVIVIDEWSHYNQLEQDLIQRFAQHYGVTVLTMGDYDQITPEATISKDSTHGKEISITPNRNMTARVAKLGVSMRTDNEVKNGNIERMLAWRKNPTDVVQLHYYEDDSGIYGDKRYAVASNYGDQLELIKADVQKMINTLKPDEVIGYVYYDTNSELYKWLTTTEGVKEHIKAMVEKDAHGLEAQYYVVENNRTAGQDALSYFSSVYTGITRSEQGSIVITNTSHINNPNSRSKYNAKGLMFETVKDNEMVPNTFTDAGTRDFSKKRKAIFDGIYGTREVEAFNIKPRRSEATPLTSNPNSPTPSPTPSPAPTPTPSPTPGPTPVPQPETPGALPAPNELPPTRTGEEVPPTWQGPLDKHQMVYRKDGTGEFVIIDEDLSDPSHPKYLVRDLSNDADYKIDKSYVASRTFTKKPDEFKLFNSGDKAFWNRNEVTITDVFMEGPADNPHWVYVIDGRAVPHSEIKGALESGQMTRQLTPEEEVPTNPLALATPEGVMQAINEEMAQEGEVAGVVGEVDGDINFRFLGFTFSSQYLADDFEDGKLVPLEEGNERIDNGYGLHKCDPTSFTSEKDIRAAIGSIRRHLEFSDNSTILRHVQDLLRGNPDMTGLKVRWGFISKAPGGNFSGKFSRYNYPDAWLEYMGKEDADVPSKTFSAIFYDKNDNPILEIPMITFQSPHSIFNEMKKRGMCPEILALWKFGKKEPQETYDCISNILDYISTNHPYKPGYQKLASILKLWLFTSNGVRMIKDSSWNFHAEVKNLGNFYITSRTSDNVEDQNFEGEWISIKEAERSDRFISNIFMNKTNEFRPAGSTESLPIFRPYTPYVFISDDPQIDSDIKAANRYIYQLQHPDAEKTVKVIPVVEPQVSVKTYIDAMERIVTGSSNSEPYGNEYTPYRIWEAILASPDRDTIMAPLSQSTKQFIVEYIDKLHQIEQQNPQNDGESNLAYKVRLANELNKVLRDTYVTSGTSTGRVFEKLRKALLDCCKYKAFGTEVKGDDHIVDLIQKAFTAAGNTGILCKSHFAPNQGNAGVGGFALAVNTVDKYNLPGQGSYRIFGKIDPPTYDMDSLTLYLEEWAKDSHFGKDIVDYRTNQVVRTLDVWEFTHDDAKDFYLSSDNRTRLNFTPILQEATNLIARLGIPEYNISESELSGATTEAEARAQAITLINKKYLEIPGTFIINDGQGGYKYGNISTDQTPEFKNYKFDSVTTSGSNYVLRFMNLDTNNMEEIEIELDSASNSFFLTPSNSPIQAPVINIASIKPEIENSIKSSLLWRNITDDKRQILEAVFNCYNGEANSVDLVQIEQLLSQANFGLATNNIRKSLKLDLLRGEQQQDLCVNPIKISFK